MSLELLAEPVSTRVARGAALLDELRPEWYDAVDVERLDMSHSLNCVLGQLYVTYEAGTQTIGLRTVGDRTLHGFTTLLYGATIGEWAELTKAWRAEIEERRAQ